MSRTLLTLVGLLLTASIATSADSKKHSQTQTIRQPGSTQQPAVKVSISTTGDALSGTTNRYKVGDQIVVAITMTNASEQQQNVCVSSNLYQNVPRLTRDGLDLPYIKWQSYEQINAERNRVCEDLDLPEPVSLRPHESKMTDFFVLVDSSVATGAEAWYEALKPGRYELSIQRRLACCDGPAIPSNQISFEVVQ
jgi:hypothetical protein